MNNFCNTFELAFKVKDQNLNIFRYKAVDDLTKTFAERYTYHHFSVYIFKYPKLFIIWSRKCEGIICGGAIQR